MYQDYNTLESKNSLVYCHFGVVGSSDPGSFKIWRKPKNARFVEILCVGGGGGGGGGGANTGAAATGGGAGGGGGSLTKTIIPAYLLPDILYTRAGIGGRRGTGQVRGGAAATGGTAGGVSYVSISPNTTAVDLVCRGNGGGAGGAAATATAGVAGTNAAIPTIATAPICGLGINQYLIGVNGGPGGTTAAGTAVTAFTVNIFACGGGGGGGTNTTPTAQAGGAITTGGTWPTIAGGAIGTNGNDGLGYGFNFSELESSFGTRYPVLFTGGSGAGGLVLNSGVGFNGGGGGPGCGGGGGGGTSGAGASETGGTGGDGGPGYIVIVTSL